MNKKPKCPTCDKKMISVEFTGYYETLYYWQCENHKCQVELECSDTDKKQKGCYA